MAGRKSINRSPRDTRLYSVCSLLIVGSDIFNNISNSLPVEMHLPGYNYLGPETGLSKCLSRGDKGINPLDEATKEHNVFYSHHKDTESCHIADKELENKAWSRVLAKDSLFGEKAAAYLTTNLMKAKRHLGMGLNDKQRYKPSSTKKNKKKKKTGRLMSLPQLVRTISKQLRRSKGITYKENTLDNLKKYATKSLTLARK